MYSNTNSCVKLHGGLTDLFHSNQGIRQGDSLSPLLFCLYIDDIRNIFDITSDPCEVESINFCHFLYADDVVLFSESKQGLQNSMNKIEI